MAARAVALKMVAVYSSSRNKLGSPLLVEKEASVVPGGGRCALHPPGSEPGGRHDEASDAVGDLERLTR